MSRSQARQTLGLKLAGWWRALQDSLRETPPRFIVEAFLAVVAATVFMLPFRERLGVLNVLLVFLLLTFALALTRGLWPSVLCAILGFVTFDILFIPPYLTFSVADEDHVSALFVYRASLSSLPGSSLACGSKRPGSAGGTPGRCWRN
ncbi:MAG: DUF4118 domain-containing protein [Thermomicrobiales bacterium]